MSKDDKKQIGEVILKNVRLSYAHLDRPQKDLLQNRPSRRNSFPPHLGLLSQYVPVGRS